MTPPEIVLKLIQFAILLFALSLHEASHAWMASRLGDQTAQVPPDARGAEQHRLRPAAGGVLDLGAQRGRFVSA